MKKVFEGNEFKGLDAAEKYVRAQWLVHGPAARDMPIGLADETEYYSVAKWYKMTLEERQDLKGVILGDKRRGPITVVLFDDEDKLEDVQW